MNPTHECDVRHRWSILLAGGEGRRLQNYTRRLYASGRPKQFCALDEGTRTMIERTLERALLFSPEPRTIVAALQKQNAWHGLTGFDSVLWSIEPHAAGTGTALLLAGLEMQRRDAGATLAVWPCDHYVSDDLRFVAHGHHAAFWVDSHPADIVLLGIPPDGPESEYGWLLAEGAEHLAGLHPARLIEKPDAAGAAELQAHGAFWNTGVVVCRLDALLGLIEALAPDHWYAVSHAFHVKPEALDPVFAMLPPLDLSRDLLAHAPEVLRVLPVYGVHWADWGTEARIRDTLENLPTVTGLHA